MQKENNRKPTPTNETSKDLSVNFEIAHLDSLGQGVFKRDGEVFFIKKTLSGETGEASFLAKQKGVHFYQLKKLNSLSPLRQESPCPHFNECGGCDYLHTTYEVELNLKKESAERLFKKTPRINEEIEMISAPNRLNYRNRVQLHYNKNKKIIGFLSLKREIFNVPDCQMMNEKVQKKFKEIIQNDHWIKLLDNAGNTGHIEIYQDKITVNRPYSEGGFTQVYEEMNLKLKEDIRLWVLEKMSQKTNLVDLFGGNGNLSEHLNFSKNLIIDYYKNAPANTAHQDFVHCDLYSDKALNILAHTKKEKRFAHTDLLLIDPPRSGLKNINEYLNLFLPSHVIYISCQATSLARDLQNLSANYKIEKIKLVDLFPSTHHFETVAFLVRNDCESTPK